MVLQLVDAILSCNRHGIAHRDIKLSNVTFPLKIKKPKNENNPLKIKKSLSATFLPFQNVSHENGNNLNIVTDNKNTNTSIISNSGNLRKGNNNEITEIDINEVESDFAFDYGELDDNSVKEKEIIRLSETENENENSFQNENENENKNENENDNSEVTSNNIIDDNIYIKLADFGMAGFIGRDGRLRGRCGTPGKKRKSKTKQNKIKLF